MFDSSRIQAISNTCFVFITTITLYRIALLEAEGWLWIQQMSEQANTIATENTKKRPSGVFKTPT